MNTMYLYAAEAGSRRLVADDYQAAKALANVMLGQDPALPYASVYRCVVKPINTDLIVNLINRKPGAWLRRIDGKAEIIYRVIEPVAEIAAPGTCLDAVKAWWRSIVQRFQRVTP